ncbi:nuclear transport factor 2 family protein [Aureisphaera galaxeae]|uniref:nuclear transport factor 2 family protein n=1 Tax=Aureisphaera galaxeae TaxID=1538023 RepID=UPI002350C5A4|nr:nuclear transport factor 2 family protein [Aureisphaera galaxeae]MDC8006156.1 nuclear transport factor 2 family protein [Aureisphaera galaxeae]
MNKEHPNLSVVMGFNPTDMTATAEVLAEDFIWHYFNPELPELEGDYLGSKGLTDFFRKMAQNSKGSFKVNPISITPMGDEFVVGHVKDTMILEDNAMEVDAVVVWRIVDGKIKEAWDMPAVNTVKFLNQKP